MSCKLGEGGIYRKKMGKVDRVKIGSFDLLTLNGQCEW